ncbi:MAG: hypothetical protein WAQ53_04970, partial [Thiofilum sp.]
LGPLRVSVKFPHDTPALVGTMRWNRGEYNIIWDEGQHYNIVKTPREWVDDAYITIGDEPAAQLGGTAFIDLAKRTVEFSESSLTLGGEDELDRVQSFEEKRVTVKFPHDTPALMGTMSRKDDEYCIIWDEGQHYNSVKKPREWVDDAYVTIEDEPAARLGGTAFVDLARRTVEFSESRLTLGGREEDREEDRQQRQEAEQQRQFQPNLSAEEASFGKTEVVLRRAEAALDGINWSDPAHIESCINRALRCIEEVAAQDIDVLSRALTTCSVLWNSRPLERARFQKLVDEKFAKR